MKLNNLVNKLKENKDILLMTHQIIGYPSFEINERAIEIFSENGVDFVELQIPFSEPVADGPLFLNANQKAVEKGVKVQQCFEFVEKMINKFDMKFIIMTYYNIVFKYGITQFVRKCKDIGVKGLIIPDAPIDDAKEFYDICKEYGVEAIGLITPYSDDERLKQISNTCEGFIYYVPRKGVTGSKTKFDKEIMYKIKSVKEKTKKNVAVGFGIQEREDIVELKGVADIAIIGSKVLKIIEEEGIQQLDRFFKGIS